MAKFGKWQTFLSNFEKVDSLEAANKQILDYLSNVLIAQPATIKYPFRRLDSSYLNILSSDDHKFRIYGWDAGYTGTARSYNAIAQYAIGSKTKALILNDVSEIPDVTCSGAYYDEIAMYRNNKGRVFYLAVEGIIVSSAAGSFTIRTFTIQNNCLVDSIPFFKTAEGKLSSITYSYDLTIADNRKLENPPSPHFSPDKKELYIPLINKNDKITSSFLHYSFDGNYFVYKGISKSASKH